MSMNKNMLATQRPVVALMTDFGLSDGYIGVMKGVIAGITPETHIIDITHDIAPQNVLSGAWILASVYRYFPGFETTSALQAKAQDRDKPLSLQVPVQASSDAVTVFACVVDPGVGSSRRAIALHAGKWFFVGPDNGLFSYVLAEQPVHAACILSNPAYHLSQVSSTFHGRDIFAPAAAHLARGIPLNDLGTPIDPATLQRIDLPRPIQREGATRGHIVHIDHFGNLISNIPLTMVPDLFNLPQVRVTFPNAGVEVSNRRRFFAEGPDDEQPFLYTDSSGYLGIAVRNGNAAKRLHIGYGTPITLVIATE
jgi:S-adenosyl-L-methionine hydrolase (adenosine-forming)